MQRSALLHTMRARPETKEWRLLVHMHGTRDMPCPGGKGILAGCGHFLAANCVSLT